MGGRLIQVLLIDKQELYHLGIQQAPRTIDDIILGGVVPDIVELERYKQDFDPEVIIAAFDILGSTYDPSSKDRLEALYPEAAILILVDTLDEETLRKLFEQSIDGIVSRDDSTEMLIEAIRSVMIDQPWYSPKFKPILMQPSRQETYTLTSRELEVLHLIVAEKTDKEIAQLLDITPRTVRFHLGSIYVKLNTKTRTGAAAEAIRRRLVG